MFLILKKNDKVVSKFKIEKDLATIGSNSGNDLVLRDRDLSPHHSTISKAAGVWIITDNGTRSGTFINGRKISKFAQIRDGDVLTFGHENQTRILVSARDGLRFPTSLADAAEKVAQAPVRYKVGGLVTALLAVFTVFLLSARNSVPTQPPANIRPENSNLAVNKTGNNNPANTNSESCCETSNAIAGQKEEPGSDLVQPEKAIKSEVNKFLRKVSTDISKPLSPIGPDAFEQIELEIEANKTEGLARTLRRFQENPGKAALLEKIRQENLPAALVIISALSELRDEGDLVSASYKHLSKIRFLSTTFGGADSDSSLIIIAAGEEGPGSSRNHPLFQRMKNIVRDVRNERNVWFIYSEGGISEKTFRKVIRFLSLGVIAQGPALHGVDAEPII